MDLKSEGLSSAQGHDTSSRKNPGHFSNVHTAADTVQNTIRNRDKDALKRTHPEESVLKPLESGKPISVDREEIMEPQIRAKRRVVFDFNESDEDDESDGYMPSDDATSGSDGESDSSTDGEGLEEPSEGSRRRRRWSTEEQSAVLSAFGKKLGDGHIPSGKEMQELIDGKICLRGRTVAQMRTWLHTYKNLQSKGSTNKRQWSAEQRSVVLLAFGRQLENGNIPSGKEMQTLIDRKHCLRDRTVAQMRTWLHTYKKKLTP